MIYNVMLVSAVQQSESVIRIHISLFFRFPSNLGHHRALSRVPCAIQSVLIRYLFYIQQCIYVNPNLPVHPTPPSPLGNHKFVLYNCVFISALQISSTVPFF